MLFWFQRSDTGMDYHTKVFDLCAEVMKLVQVLNTMTSQIRHSVGLM